MLGLNIDYTLCELKDKFREFKKILDKFQELDANLLNQVDNSHLHGFIEKKNELCGNLTYLIEKSIANNVFEEIDGERQRELINFLNERIGYLVSLYDKDDEAKKVDLKKDLDSRFQIYLDGFFELKKYYDEFFKMSSLNGNKEKTKLGGFFSLFRPRKITPDNKNKDLDITAADVSSIAAKVSSIATDVNRIAADVNRIAADVEQGLVKRDFNKLDAEQRHLLRVKISEVINSKFSPTGINVSTLCDAIAEYETNPEVKEGFLDTPTIDIKSVLKFYENKTNEDILKPRRDIITPTYDAHPEILFEDNGYKLVKLVSEPHLEQQSKKLIKHEKYLFGRSDNTIVLTIEYDVMNGKIQHQQIGQVEDALLKGDKKYFKAFISFLKNLINKKNINDIEKDFVDIKLGDNEFLTQRGIVNVSELDERDFMIKGKLAVNDRNYEVAFKFLSYSGIIFDFTELNDDRKCIIEEIKGSIFDDSEEISYKRLKSVGGNLDAHSATSLKLGILQKVGGNLDAHSATSLYLPSLEEVSGNLDAHSVTFLELEGLEEVGGNLDAHSATFSNLRILQKVGGNLDVGSATSLKLEKLETVGSNLDAHSATTHLSLPSLEEIGGNLDACSAIFLNLRVLKKIGGNLDARGATTLDLERLETVIGDLYALNAILLGLKNFQNVHKIFVSVKSRSAVKEAINPSLYRYLKKYKSHKSKNSIMKLFS